MSARLENVHLESGPIILKLSKKRYHINQISLMNNYSLQRCGLNFESAYFKNGLIASTAKIFRTLSSITHYKDLHSVRHFFSLEFFD
jgi:hypothetical protein